MLKRAPTKGHCSGTARDQIVRACRATLGDELRCVGYVSSDDREWLYAREDVSLRSEPYLPIPTRCDDPELDSGNDEFAVLVFVNEPDCAVFIGPTDDTVSRCNGTSLKNHGEIEAAVAEIVRTANAN